MKKVINYKVEGEQWTNAQDKAFEKLNKTAKIDGFRPGHAPKNMFIKKYGEQEILLEAADELIKEKYSDIIVKDKIMPVVEPKVEPVSITKDAMEVNFTFVVKSEVKLGEYKDLKIKKDAVKVTKEEVEHEIEHLLEHYAEIEEKDGKIEFGDTAIINFEGFKDGVAFEGGKGENYPLEIGSNSFIPGFEEGLIGLSKGEEKDLELTFPENYMSEELKGQKVVFKVKINDVKTRVIPELNKEFFDDLNMEGVTNKEELAKMMEERIKSDKEMHAENKYVDDILEAAAKNMTVELDEELTAEEENRMYEDFLDKLAMQGLTEDIYLKYANTTKEDILKEMHPEAEKRVKYRYLLEAVIKSEKIKTTDKEAEKEAEDYAKKYNTTKEEFIKQLGSLDVLKYELNMRKAIDVMKGSK